MFRYPVREHHRFDMNLVRILAVTIATALMPSVAHASFLHGETLDAAATVIAWVVICVVPIVVIVLFWLVHVMPEKIAEKRHHPQKEAITTLCLLSLVFGGLLWPIAWLWAYTKPVGYRMAYGSDKHDDYYDDMSEKFRSGALLASELAHLREELDAMAAKGTLPVKLRALREELTMLRAEAQAARAAASAAETTAGAA
jgi:CBS domain containing-hemolysin-like protein